MYYKIISPVERSNYVCLAAGLVDLMQDDQALALGLNAEWVMLMIKYSLWSGATLDEYRAYFMRLRSSVYRTADQLQAGDLVLWDGREREICTCVEFQSDVFLLGFIEGVGGLHAMHNMEFRVTYRAAQ
jgi:hypothetical protein